MLVRTCFGLAWAIVLAGVVFAALVLFKGSGDAGLTAVLVALILGPTILSSRLVALVGLSIRADETAARSS